MSRTRSSWLEYMRALLLDFDIDVVTKENCSQVVDVFYSNESYYRLTDGRPATESDCLDSIDYCPQGFDPAHCHMIGLSKKGVAVGVVSCLDGYPETNIFWIGLLLVHGEVQRKGVGSQIANAIAAAAETCGFTAVRLSVQNNNHSGLNFWKKHDFLPIEDTPACVNGIAVKVLLMERLLGNASLIRCAARGNEHQIR